MVSDVVEVERHTCQSKSSHFVLQKRIQICLCYFQPAKILSILGLFLFVFASTCNSTNFTSNKFEMIKF